MRKSASKRRSVARFHIRQFLSILLVFATLVTVLTALFFMHYSKIRNHDEALLEKKFLQVVSQLDNLLGTATTHVEGMRLKAEADLFESRAPGQSFPPLAFGFLADRQSADGKRFHLDQFKPPLDKGLLGNLTGEGSFRGRSTDFYRELHMALRLNADFRSVAGSVRDAAWVYYTSANSFLNIYPWVSSLEFSFSKEMFSHEFFSYGLPEKNPERKLFWTDVYVDEYGKGLMTTCAAPVYDESRFLGTVAIDLTVDYLNSIVERGSTAAGVIFLVNDTGKIVAHPALITSKDARAKLLSEALPDGLADAPSEVLKLPENRLGSIGGHTLLRAQLMHAPWQVIYLAKTPAFWDAFKDRMGTGLIIAVGGLLLLTVAVLVLTFRQFIRPSERFFNYILARSRRKKVPEIGSVPPIWRPWFSAIEATFSENEALAKQISRHNRELEQRVSERTFALAESNRKLENEIAERASAERAIRTVFDSVYDAICIHSLSGKILEVNRKFVELYGISRKEALQQGSIEDLSGPNAPIHELPDMWQKVSAGETLLVEWEARRPEGGDVFPVEVYLRKIEMGGEAVILACIRDISEQRLASLEKETLHKRLSRSRKMEALGLLAGGVAHDLNNVLAGLVSYPDLLLMDLPQESPMRKPIQTILDSGQKASAIVQDLLTLARRGVRTMAVVNLNEIVTEYLKSPEYDKVCAFHPNIRVSPRLAPELLNILGSPVHLRKTVMNLITNAVEALPEGGGEILIATGNRYVDAPLPAESDIREGDYALLTVADNGIGMSTEEQSRIFEPFYTKKKMGRSGTGLGMAVVWGAVQDHAGHIDIESRRGEGTTFHLHFPATRNEAEKERGPVPAETYRGEGEAILVIDDVRQQREIVVALLEKLGYRAFAVSSGERALEYLDNHPADLLILDMIMAPGMDGLETYEKVIERHPGQRAVIASGFAENDRVRAAQKLGAGEYVRKPYTIEKIGMAIRRELTRPRP